jgi:nitrate/TMAO reductase-like tetraheme cytochrome c subunit
MLLAAAAVVADERFPLITSEAVKTACSDCHMVYPPQMLPRASWQALMDRLDDHFGENASVAEPMRQEVRNYYLAHAADVDRSKAARAFLRGLDLQHPPLRITETPRFLQEHRKIPAATWQHPKVVSKANCGACHPGATHGDYDEARLP